MKSKRGRRTVAYLLAVAAIGLAWEDPGVHAAPPPDGGGLGEDCNGNGIPDVQDLAGGSLRLQPGPDVPGKTGLVTLADLDGDRDLDMGRIGSIVTGGVTVLLNQGGGGFTAAGEYNSALLAGGPWIAAGDIDGDGSIDIVTHSAAFLNQGDATFNEVLELAVHDSDLVFAHFVAPGDLDGDGDLDVVTTNQDLREARTDDPDVSVLLNRGGGRFERARHFASGLEFCPYNVTLGDLDSDGDLDIVTPVRWMTAGNNPEFAHSISLLFHRGDGAFAQAELLGVRAECSATPGDFDGDGDLDIVALQAGCQSVWGGSLLLNTGKGVFEAGTPLPDRAAGECRNDRFPTAADLDGDGALDLVLGAAVLLNQGEGTFGFPVAFAADGSYPVQTGDLDGDADLDLVAGRGDALTVILNRTAPPFSQDLDSNGIPDECEQALFRRGEASADGRLDITDAVFTLGALFRGGPQPSCPDAADVDDNGRVNIADPIYTLNHLFLGGPSPPAPGPGSCGLDPTQDDLTECAHEPLSC